MTTTAVTVPWGEFLSIILPLIGSALFGVIIWGLSYFAPPIYQLLRTAQLEQVLSKAIAFGINAVRGATHDKTLSVDVGNAVLREALTYALDHGGTWLRDFGGDPAQLAEKIYARLNLPGEAARPNFQELVDAAR